MTILSTQSSWQSFKNCQRKHAYRYIEHLVPLTEDAHALFFGKAWDQMLNAWYTASTGYEARDAAIASVIAATGDDSFALTAMLKAYVAWAGTRDDGYDTTQMQVTWEADLVNPDTGSPSKTFTIAGVADGLWRRRSDGTLWLLENKTTSSIDAEYLDKLWTDWQILIYTAHLSEKHGPIAGVIYNIAEKPGCKRTQVALTDDLGLKVVHDASGARVLNKNGTPRQTGDSAQGYEIQYRDMTDAEWEARLAKNYAAPESGEVTRKFHREEILFDAADLADVRAELWALSQSWLDARRRGRWFKNTSQCYAWNRPCDYLALCRSHDNPIVRETQYRMQAPHGELPVRAPVQAEV